MDHVTALTLYDNGISLSH